MKWYEKQKQLFEQQKNEKEASIEELTESEDSISEAMSDTMEELSREGANMEQQEDSTVAEKTEPVYTSQHVQETSAETTIVQKNTVIKGNIETSDHVTIYGTLIGDINCSGNLCVYGNVQGNIECRSASLHEARIEGKLTCSGSAELSEKTIVHGDVNAVNLQCGGQIKGNVVIEELAHFAEKSAVIGDISTLEIEIERGAVIQGTIKITESVEF